MSGEHQIEILPTGILVGISSGDGILDFVAKKEQIEAGIRRLHAERANAEWETVGSFGVYAVTLYVPQSGPASLFIDGPDVIAGRNLSAAITPGDERLVAIFSEALKMANQPPEPTARAAVPSLERRRKN